jgi:flagellar assembly protein FliH
LPDGGEKRSLNDSGKNIIDTTDVSPNEIKLHYFPDIPVDDPDADPNPTCADRNFKRAHFESPDCTCTRPEDKPDETIVEEDPSPIAEIEAQAYEKGFSDGQSTAIAAQSEQVESAVKGLEQAIIGIQNLRDEIYRTLESEVVALAMSIARKVVCREVKTSNDVVVCVAKEALSRIETPGQIKIRLNPADYQFIKETKNHIATLVDNVEKVTFETEDSIASGGCVIETDMGEIDARIEKQLHVVEEMFQSEIAKSEPEGNID